MQQVSEHVYVETGFEGCTVSFVVTDDGVVCIDTPQRPSEALRWRAEAERHGPVRYVINTEHHKDHTTGNFFFPGTVIAHEKTREKFEQTIGTLEALRARVAQMWPDDLPLIEGYRYRPPSITFSDEMTLYLGRHTFRLIRMVGHTENEAVVHLPGEGVIFTTDNLFNNCMPFLHECLPGEWIQTLGRLERLEGEVLVPGHGEVTTKAALRPLAAFIQEVMDEVGRAIDQGWSREETAERITFIERFPIPWFLKERAPEVQRMNVRRVYDQLMAQRRT
ncbi:MAG: MBL fold metallo-hydrolase [Deltaproteobacteria bacterium]|nr:MBL fold metallo-hydrolase [Deltaproteobacteria bacterium]